MIPGTIAPDAVTIQVETAVDDEQVGTVDFVEEITVDDGVSIQAAPAAAASDLTFIVVDLETGLEIDRGTADADGRATLDAEFDAAFYVAVADTDSASEAILLGPGESVSILAVQYVASGVTPSTGPTVTPTTVPTAPESVDPTAVPSTAGGAITLPNTGSGAGSPADMTLIALLLTLLAAVAITLGTTGILRGRRN